MAKSRTLKKHEAKIGLRADGTPITKKFYGITLAAAKQKAKQYQREIEYNPSLVSLNQFYVRGWAKTYLLQYKKPFVSPNAYITTYESIIYRHILPALGDMQLCDVTPETIQALYDDKKHLSQSMCKKITMNLNGIFETAIDAEKCHRNPARFRRLTSQQLPGVREIYEDRQIRVAERWFMRVMPEVALLLETGARRECLCGWHTTDFDVKRNVYRIGRAVIYQKDTKTLALVPPKRNSHRTNPLSPVGRQAYEALVRKYHDPASEHYVDSPFLLPGEDGGPTHPERWSARLKAQMKRMCLHHKGLSMPALSSHELRHTYGTYLNRHGVDIYTIAKVLGHKSIDVTSNTYVHTEMGVLRRALKHQMKQELIA